MQFDTIVKIVYLCRALQVQSMQSFVLCSRAQKSHWYTLVIIRSPPTIPACQESSSQVLLVENSRKHPEKIIAPIASPNQMLPPLLKMGKDWRTHEPPNVPDFGRSKLQFDPCPFRQATSSPQDSWGLKGSRADSQASPDPKTNGWTSQM